MRYNLTVDAISKRLSVKPSRVKRWISSGQLKAIQLPGGTYESFRTSEEWFDQFVQSHLVKTKSSTATSRRRSAQVAPQLIEYV